MLLRAKVCAEYMCDGRHRGLTAHTVQPQVKFVYDEAGMGRCETYRDCEGSLLDTVISEFRAWLCPPNRDPNNTERKRQAGSCQWFFDDQFKAWKGLSNGVYWVHGNGMLFVLSR